MAGTGPAVSSPMHVGLAPKTSFRIDGPPGLEPVYSTDMKARCGVAAVWLDAAIHRLIATKSYEQRGVTTGRIESFIIRPQPAREAYGHSLPVTKPVAESGIFQAETTYFRPIITGAHHLTGRWSWRIGAPCGDHSGALNML
jgi:hypothetical protein